MLLTVLSVILCLFGAVSAAEQGTGVLDLVKQSTVMISSGDPVEKGWGSGFFINGEHVITNHHVISPYLEDGTAGGKGWWVSAINTTVRVYYSYLANDFVYGIVMYDWPEVDLAVIQVAPGYVKRLPLKFLSADKVSSGMEVYAIGFPAVNYSGVLELSEPSLADGIISNISTASISNDAAALGLAAEVNYQRLSVTAVINQGNSGGPIVDRRGNLVGIANAEVRDNGAVASFGIHVRELINRLNYAGIRYLQ